jgi:ATP-grasp domain, R2K clade family 3
MEKDNLKYNKKSQFLIDSRGFTTGLPIGVIMRFLFPGGYFDTKRVDADYAAQAESLRDRGFEISTIGLETLNSGLSRIYPPPHNGETLIYRGWMVTADRYHSLITAVENAGANFFISPAEYLATHHLPNWYPLIRDLTPETHVFSVDENLEGALRGLGWSRFFVKDYVKSLKTSVGSIIHDPAEIATVVAEMRKFRGQIEGGLCIRQVEEFIPETEERYFVLNGKPFGSRRDRAIPAIVWDCAQRINSKFFTVDVVERSDGQQRIVEIGDGQVSNLVGWTVDQFTALWSDWL